MALRRIRAGAYFDGTALHEDGPYLIAVSDGTIRSIASAGAGSEPPDLTARFVLPGLVDAHVHLFLDGAIVDPAQRAAQLQSGRAAMLETARSNLARCLRAGVTLLRDAGDAYGVNHAIREELRARQDTPLAVRSPGAGLRRPRRYGRILAREVAGTNDIAAAVETAARDGDDIKIILTDIIDFETGGMKGPPQFDADETRLIVAEAHRHGRKTFAHCSGSEGLDIAVAAGVNSIEHGYFMTRDILKRMADARIAWVPTFAPVRFQRARPDIAGWSGATLAHLDRLLASHAEHVALAHELDVPLMAGSDAGSPGVGHGSGLIDELLHMRQAGLPLAAVLRAATAQPRAHFGLPPCALAPGAPAELVLLGSSPTHGPEALRDVLGTVKGDTVWHSGSAGAVS